MYLFLGVVLILTLSLFAENKQVEIVEKGFKATEIKNGRDAPNYEFITPPTNLCLTYYDYQPGSYNGLPIKVQPEISTPNGYNAGGIYISYQAKETATGNRRAFFSYIDQNGNIVTTSTISNDNIWEGFLGMDIDPVTANPFTAWHVDVDDDNPQEILYSYDFYHAMGGAGMWNTPEIAIDNGNISSPHEDDKFIWPNVNIGPSPLGVEYRRVYITAANATNHGVTSARNPLIAYADFTTTDLDNMTPLDWTYSTIPQMDEWDSDDPEIHTQSKWAFVTSETDGTVAFIGWNVQYGFFCFLNENYGAGEFQYYHDEYKKYVDNPLNENGSHFFIDADGDPYENMNFFFRFSGHFNAEFIDNSTIRFIANMGLQAEYGEEVLYWGHCVYPKEFKFDVNTHEFGFFDLYPQGANPADDNPMLPWDLDEDGVVDNYTEDGKVDYVRGWPFQYHLDAADENTYKIAKNEENGWLVATWHDGLNAKFANTDELPEYEDWAEYPEIAIAISSDNGLTWSEPILMNAKSDDENFVPEFDDMIPVYLYPGDYIEEIDDTHGKLHLFFLDDNSYGSHVLGNGIENGGMLKYASINIEFPEGSNSEENNIAEVPNYNLRNFPNPLNSETIISFNLNNEQSEQVKIEIYNVKGQRVDQLEIRNYDLGMNEIVYSADKLSSGVYFYKLVANNNLLQTKKMLLIK